VLLVLKIFKMAANMKIKKIVKFKNEKLSMEMDIYRE
jgi:hypothetical protein